MFSAEIPNDENIVRSSFHSDFDYAQDDTAGRENIKFYCFYPSQSATLTALPKGEPIDASPLAVVGKSNQSLPAGGGGNPSEPNVSEAVDGRGRVHIGILS